MRQARTQSLLQFYICKFCVNQEACGRQRHELLNISPQTNGLMAPDNGFTERAIRKFAIGRNNWLFCETTEGAEASSLLYSLTVTAKLNGVNAYKALSKILTEVPLAKTLEDYERLADFILTPEGSP